MKVLLFTHKNDIDGMGNAILGQLAFKDFTYELCATFDLTKTVLKYFEDGSIYTYDKIFITDLCPEDPILTMLGDERLEGKVQVLDHHKTYDEPKYKEKPFIKVQLQDEKGLCCGTSLFYKYLQDNNLLEANPEIDEFVELTRQHDTWEWRNIYNNEKSRELAVLFDSLGYDGYITLTTEKLRQQNPSFEFTPLEQTLIKNRKKQIEEKCKLYENEIYYKEILGMKAGILFIDYEYRNEIAEYFRQNNFDMDFTMMISLDRGVVCYRSVKPGKAVRPVAELFGGKGHDKAATNPITEDQKQEILKVLTKEK